MHVKRECQYKDSENKTQKTLLNPTGRSNLMEVLQIRHSLSLLSSGISPDLLFPQHSPLLLLLLCTTTKIIIKLYRSPLHSTLSNDYVNREYSSKNYFISWNQIKSKYGKQWRKQFQRFTVVKMLASVSKIKNYFQMQHKIALNLLNWLFCYSN